MKNKLFIVKSEVLAPNIKKAILAVAKGKVYEITEALEQYQPVDSKKVGITTCK